MIEKPLLFRVWLVVDSRLEHHQFQSLHSSRLLSLQSNAGGLICRSRKVRLKQQTHYHQPPNRLRE